MQDDGAHGGVGGSALIGFEDGGAQRLAEGVDRRTSQADQGQVAFDAVVDECGHGEFRVSLSFGRGRGHG
ncbi:hypothetical protein D3C76_1647710 [compost metagenome]